MRLFLAINLPEREKTALAGLQSLITSGRRVDPDLFHVTVAFLGRDVSHEEAEELHELLESARLPRMTVHLEGVGHFGRTHPKALWVAVKPTGSLAPLHAKTVRFARMAGLDVPRRRFVPHVTLARYSEGDTEGHTDFAKLVARRPPFVRPPFDVTHLQLMESHLKSSGPEYQTLASYPLT